jgi:RHS repeat-associated protein
LRVALTDERGSVAGLTDATGALTDTFAYGPYGEDWGQTGTNPLAFRWLGGYGVRHAGGSLYVTRFRAYDADARRFLSADPLGLAGGGNLYAYGAGDPMFFIDPLGLEAMIRQGHNELSLYLRMVGRNLLQLGYDVFIDPYVQVYDAQTSYLNNPTLEGACYVLQPSLTIILFALLSIPDVAVHVKGTPILLDEAAEKNQIVFRYVSEAEAKVAQNSGVIPNVTPAGTPKNVYYSPEMFSSASAAEDAILIGNKNPLGPTQTPTHRITVDSSKAKWNYGGNVESGTGIELITTEELPVLRIDPLAR